MTYTRQDAESGDRTKVMNEAGQGWPVRPWRDTCLDLQAL